MPMAGAGAPNTATGKIVALDVDITIDQKDPNEMGNLGDHHSARVFYDPSQIDPMTQRVVVLHEQHTPALIPKHLNPGQMPMTNAWLDLSGPQIAYHFAAAPTVGFPAKYFILFDETTRRMTIRSQDAGTVLLAGPYTVNPAHITGPDVDAVVGSSDPAVPPWDTSVSFPGLPGPGH